MSDATSITESAQALFCAMADFIGAPKVDKIFNTDLYPDYESFKMKLTQMLKLILLLNSTWIQM